MLQVVIVHPEKGIFLGMRGDPVFAKADGFAAFKSASAFRSEADAHMFVRGAFGMDPADFDYRLVRVAELGRATFAELREAGLGSHLNQAIHKLLALAAA